MDDILQIRQAHLATLHLLMLQLAEQRAFNQELIKVLAELSKKDYNTITSEINRVMDERYQKIHDSLFQVYGIVDVDDLLKDKLDS